MERMFDNFTMNFPFVARNAVSYRKDSATTLVIKLADGTSVLWDDMDRIMSRLPEDSMNMTENECRREFGKRLYRIMLRKHITQEELSLATGISRPLISNYITGKNTPSFYNVDKIAKTLGCSTDELRYID